MFVLFPDESKLNLRDSDCIRRVRKGTVPGQGIGSIYKIDGIIDRFTYRDVLKDVMLPYAEEERTFHLDNNPKHTSKVVKE